VSSDSEILEFVSASSGDPSEDGSNGDDEVISHMTMSEDSGGSS